ncbi:MAG: coenzyme F420-0:L-glutamate ligase [Candidatus Cloacimonetes bacterium]|nr:coenzyme F420-0:L-glutamate ligase [Candidatus Cloacimonadota bacterium]
MKEKKPTIEWLGKTYLRIPVKTRILTPADDIVEIIREYAAPQMKPGDIITVSESPLAITQGRAVPVSKIKVGFVARHLWKCVAKVPYGIGLRSPYSMQCAIDECGTSRILLAAVIGGLGKVIGRKGDFYRVAGMQAGLIDAASTSPVPPYTECVIKGPLHPEIEARRIKASLGFEAAIMDINDIGGSWAIGYTDGLKKEMIEAVMKDNPQGQGDELTPICIVRKIDNDEAR